MANLLKETQRIRTQKIYKWITNINGLSDINSSSLLDNVNDWKQRKIDSETLEIIIFISGYV